MCVNNIEVTVNTYMFTVITIKGQSGGIYSSYSTSGQEFMAIVNKPCPQAAPSDLFCLLP